MTAPRVYWLTPRTVTVHPGGRRRASLSLLALVAGVATLVLPTISSLAQYHWNTEGGAQGPIILVSGLWLIWREREKIKWRPRSIPRSWLLLLAPLLIVYALATGFNLLGTRIAALYLIMILLGFFYLGVQCMRHLWPTILYLGFIVKPAESIVSVVTGPLQRWLSAVSTQLLRWVGYPIGSSGVRIQLAQYELLVAQPCAGIGSMFTLLAIGVLYIHLAAPKGKLHRTLLLVGIVPLAIAANLVRVMVIILLTYHAGDAIAQSFAHEMAGVATFILSLIGMFALDALLTWRALHR